LKRPLLTSLRGFRPHHPTRLAAVAATAATARFQGDIQTFAVQKTTNRFSKPANRMVIGFKRQQAARFYN